VHGGQDSVGRTKEDGGGGGGGGQLVFLESDVVKKMENKQKVAYI
jgi:hypothetical protein